MFSNMGILEVGMFAVLLVRSCLGQYDAYVQPDKTVIIHLFEWPYADVALECERFLSERGIGGVQISPPTENIVVFQDTVHRPWWERYQPVSYNIATRSGGVREFEDMIARCNNVGVRIYVDTVFNHMTGWWPDGTPTTGASGFNPGAQDYPGVPFSSADFNDANCYTGSGGIENYGDPVQVRNCKLSGMNDLNQGSENVRGKIRDYLNYCIDIGVAGFRIDAAKHMWPADLKAIFDSLNNLNTTWFPADARAFIMQEVIDQGGEPITVGEYVGNGMVTEFKYGLELGNAFRGNNLLKWLVNFGEGWGFVTNFYAVVFIDNHDNQRGHGGGGDMILTFRQDRWYKMAVGFMLAWTYGFPRLMSSYNWDQNWVNGHDANDWVGPPHDGGWSILSPSINADGTCGNGWVCEHRWREIFNMVKFRNVVFGSDINHWWDNGSNQIFFCRGDKGCVAINNDWYDMKQTIQTGLSPGVYCDVISGDKYLGSCTGKYVTVQQDGRAYMELLSSDYDGILALHVEAKL